MGTPTPTSSQPWARRALAGTQRARRGLRSRRHYRSCPLPTELGFSSKPVVGPLITGVKKLNLRLLSFVLDDLARQVDAAIARLETALAAEIAAREAAARTRGKGAPGGA